MTYFINGIKEERNINKLKLSINNSVNVRNIILYIKTEVTTLIHV